MDPTASAADNPIVGKGQPDIATVDTDPPLVVPEGERALYTRVFFRYVLVASAAFFAYIVRAPQVCGASRVCI